MFKKMRLKVVNGLRINFTQLFVRETFVVGLDCFAAQLHQACGNFSDNRVRNLVRQPVIMVVQHTFFRLMRRYSDTPVPKFCQNFMKYSTRTRIDPTRVVEKVEDFIHSHIQVYNLSCKYVLRIIFNRVLLCSDKTIRLMF